MYLSEPLAQITQHIEQNLRKLEDHKEKLQQDEMTAEEFEKARSITVTRIELEKLAVQQTVCAHPDCADYYKKENDFDIELINYRTICHVPCKVRGPEFDLKGCRQLQYCRVLKENPTSCIVCKHPYTDHLHMIYKTIPKSVFVIDKNDQGKIKEMKFGIDKVNKIIEGLENKQSDIREEKLFIQKSLAQFTFYLNKVSMVKYNDRFEEYTTMMLENMRNSGTRNSNQLAESYQKLLDSYREEIKLLEQEYCEEDSNQEEKKITAQDVLNVVEKLYNLKIYGSTIQKACQIHIEVENEYVPPGTVVQYIAEKLPSCTKLFKMFVNFNK